MVAWRASPGRGEKKVVRQDIATLRSMKWINDSIANFVGKVMIQSWRERAAQQRCTCSVHT